MSLDSFTQRFLKYQLLIVVGIFVALGILLGVHLWQTLNIAGFNRTNIITKQHAGAEENIFSKRTNGQGIQNESEQNLFPIAVTIDNHPDAWPNFGLSEADIVYETLVEGSATRFLAIFTVPTNNILEKIGPIRSVRPYFLRIVKEYDALLTHSGGSEQALADIEALEINNLEEIAWWGPDYFWRVYSRLSPHNLFTSGDNLRQALVDWGLEEQEPDFKDWEFNKEINIENLEEVEKVEINFSLYDGYNVRYEYNTSTKTYLRWQGEAEHIDALTNKQIEAKNVAVQFVPQAKILDEVGRISLEMVGSGEAIIFRNGVAIEGEWRKRTDESRTVFYNNNGDEIEFNPGQIWIEIVPEDRQVYY